MSVVLGGETDAISERFGELTGPPTLAAGLQQAVTALAGPDRTLGAADLEVAVLQRGIGRRAFRRLDDDEVTAALTGCATYTPPIDWTRAGEVFTAGEEQAPMVYNKKDASRCVGRWTLHSEAVDVVGKFPSQAHGAFPEELRWQSALSATEFFRLDPMNAVTFREGYDQAASQLSSALGGSRDAFRLYFEALGQCSTKPETVRDVTSTAIDAAADE